MIGSHLERLPTLHFTHHFACGQKSRNGELRGMWECVIHVAMARLGRKLQAFQQFETALDSLTTKREIYSKCDLPHFIVLNLKMFWTKQPSKHKMQSTKHMWWWEIFRLKHQPSPTQKHSNEMSDSQKQWTKTQFYHYQRRCVWAFIVCLMFVFTESM